MTFKELGNIHPQILEKCKERAIEQGGKIILDKNVSSSKSAGGFDWINTIEHDLKAYKDCSFWLQVLGSKNFNKFYELYPLQPNTKVNYISSNKVYKASFNGKNYEITIKEI